MVLNRQSDFLLTVGQWVHCRIECVPLAADEAGRQVIDVREYQDGRLVTRRHDNCRYADWAVMMSARNAKVSIGDVTIWKMLPLDGPAEK